ncbi:hypothetical protein L218DRAFT_490795 [Marasmius fiardii PR-910]|nr:hypothetical protein L218DRAFT_490795 [Marasmius fiardii PR-910]
MPNHHYQNEILNHASEVTIHGGSFSNVGRDQYQYHHCTVQQTIVHTQQRKDLEVGMHLPELSEFTEVKRGDIYKNPNGVCYSWRLCSNGKDNTEAAVYHAELNIAGPFGQKKFTVKTYRGRNAMKEWHQDFLRCSDSEDWCRDIPLFGYSMTSVPLLILCGELFPVAHVRPGAGLPVNLMRVYFEVLKGTLGCHVDEIWMDPTNGRFCRGPAGPECWDWFSGFSGIKIPADVNFLKEGVFIRGRHKLRARNIRSTNHPRVISSLNNSLIAMRQDVRWTKFKGCRGRKVVQHGLTRFRLKDGQHCLKVCSSGEASSWFAQALSIFHAHGIRLDEDLSLYKLVYASFKLEGMLDISKCKQQRRQLCEPIYFFLEPRPSPDRHFYFWSHDPTGQNPLSLDMCNYLGLPFKFSLEVGYWQKTWSTKIYKALHDYQISRGFDPRTTDFAHSMRYPIWEGAPPENQFQELNEVPHNTWKVQCF